MRIIHSYSAIQVQINLAVLRSMDFSKEVSSQNEVVC